MNQAQQPIAIASRAPPRRRRLIWRAIAWITILAIAIVAFWRPWADRSIPVTVARATQIDLEGSFTAEAYVRGRDYLLGSETAGRVVALRIREGDRVKRGDLLLSVNSDDARQSLLEAQAATRAAQLESARATASLHASQRELDARVKAARADLAQAEAALRRARAGARPEEISQAQHILQKTKAVLDDAKKSLDRAKFLADQGAIPLASLDEAQSRYDAANADVETARDALMLVQSGPRKEDIAIAQMAVDSARAALALAKSGAGQLEPLRLQVVVANTSISSAQSAEQRARQALSRADLLAPVDDAITKVNIESGTVVAAGTPIITLSTREDLRVEAEISSEDAGKIRDGMPVHVTSPAYPGRVFPAHLVQAMPVGELKPDAAHQNADRSRPCRTR